MRREEMRNLNNNLPSRMFKTWKIECVLSFRDAAIKTAIRLLYPNPEDLDSPYGEHSTISDSLDQEIFLLPSIRVLCKTWQHQGTI